MKKQKKIQEQESEEELTESAHVSQSEKEILEEDSEEEKEEKEISDNESFTPTQRTSLDSEVDSLGFDEISGGRPVRELEKNLENVSTPVQEEDNQQKVERAYQEALQLYEQRETGRRIDFGREIIPVERRDFDHRQTFQNSPKSIGMLRMNEDSSGGHELYEVKKEDKKESKPWESDDDKIRKYK